MITTRDVARSVRIAPRTKRFVLRDEYGCRYDGRQAELILAALSRSDRSEGLDTETRTVAYALRKSITTGRMSAAVANRICELTPVSGVRRRRPRR